MLSTKGLSIKPIIHSQSTIKSNFRKPEVISKWTFQIIDTHSFCINNFFTLSITTEDDLTLIIFLHFWNNFHQAVFLPILETEGHHGDGAIISYRTVFPSLMNLTFLCLQFPYILSWVPNCNLSCELSNSHLLSHFITTIWISRVTQAPWILLSNPLNQGINLVPEMT